MNGEVPFPFVLRNGSNDSRIYAQREERIRLVKEGQPYKVTALVFHGHESIPSQSATSTLGTAIFYVHRIKYTDSCFIVMPII